MSPRRMDISSLLRDPSPPSEQPPRHPYPASIQSILNTPRPPFGLDALVHVAAQERRRISARDSPRFAPQDIHHAALYAPHKRARDSPPRSPSPDLRLSQLSSPSTRHHSSASPINNYPALRPFDPTPSRPAPPFANDSRPITLQHTSPYQHTFHPPLPSPRDISPLRHSPQLLRSQQLSSPTSFVSPHAESGPMSPRYGHGPKMAGGIEVLSNDAPTLRDVSRLDLSYQSPGRDMSVERLLCHPRLEHPRHELPKLSPLSARAFPLGNDTYPSESLYHESVLLRDHPRSRPRLPLNATTDTTKYTGIQSSQPSSHPVRVWEAQPTVRDTSQRVSPVHSLSIVNPAEEHRQQPIREDWRAELQQDVSQNVPCQGPKSHPTLVSGHPAFASSAHANRNSDPPPLSLLPQSPVYHPHVLQTLPQDSSTPCPPSPGSHSENLETTCEPKGLDIRVDASTSALLASGTFIAEPSLGKGSQMPGPVNADDVLVTNPLLPSPHVAQPVQAKESGMSLSLAAFTPSASRSPSQQPLPVPSPVKDQRTGSLANVLISALVLPETSRRSPEPENLSERELPTAEQVMMDVEEELLSLVEDRPVPSSSKMRAGSGSLPSTTDTIIGARQRSNETSDDPSLTLASHPVLKGPPLMTDKEKDRASMPPPAARSKKVEKDKTAPATGAVTGSKKKKDGPSKPVGKPKPPPKQRAKPAPKPKPKPSAVDSSSKGSTLKGTVNVNARSRSTSVIPSTLDDVVPEPEVDNSEKEDDKLYCVCKTRYDEDRMMIACDRCDEWFHTLCVNMPDLEIDLVDQFICPPCVQKHPHLRTTWKRRCLFGLQHENPSSPNACHKPSRGAFSKYCSDDCGIKYMQAHIAQWEKSGGARDMLWDSVKNATKREGVVVSAKMDGPSPRVMDIDSRNSATKPPDSAAKRRAEREVARLNTRLEELVKERELMKRELDIVIWREKVVELASERAGKMDECGWDQRLCFGEEEWADFGPEVLESYEDARVKMESEQDAMPLETADSIREEWWCTGKKKCERHAGWQKLRAAEVSFDKETKEVILLKLTAREREIRKSIEDILYPQVTSTLQALPKPPHPEVQPNGLEKSP